MFEVPRSSSQKSVQEEMPMTVARWETEVTFAKRFVRMYPPGVPQRKPDAVLRLLSRDSLLE